ncbi:hypothetical protein [Saccharothrix xinjiangensis]|uniref:Uncharacterized protein n=1 Tax=Saccharothrix xinjiangensis TaxID=204798 RepID=A0ABV9XXG0_9PSEU
MGDRIRVGPGMREAFGLRDSRGSVSFWDQSRGQVDQGGVAAGADERPRVVGGVGSASARSLRRVVALERRRQVVEHRWGGGGRRPERGDVVAVGAGRRHGRGRAATAGDQVVLGARPGAGARPVATRVPEVSLDLGQQRLDQLPQRVLDLSRPPPDDNAARHHVADERRRSGGRRRSAMPAPLVGTTRS